MLPNLSIGVDGWQRPEMVSDYYPEGLPDDWRFDYYFNDFRVVLVAPSDWLEWGDLELEELLNCRRDDSAIFLKIANWQPHYLDTVNRIKRKVGDLMAGVLVFDDAMSVESISQLPGALTRVSHDLRLPGWAWECRGWVVSGAPVGWLDQMPNDMKQLRVFLQDFVSSLPDKNTGYGFFVGGESIKIGEIQKLKTLAELMGY
jgi:hypothetical protein